MDNKLWEKIEGMATNYICPLTNEPRTPYEKGQVKSLTRFGYWVMTTLKNFKIKE